MIKRTLHSIKKYDFKLADFAKPYVTDFIKFYMIATLATKANKAVGYSVFHVISHRSRNKIKTNTISSFKGYKNSKSIYNRLKLPRISYNLYDYFR